MPGHKRLDPMEYEAAFLFKHFINSCHVEASDAECSSSSSEADFWTNQENLNRVTRCDYCRQRSISQACRTRSVDQSILDASDRGIWDQEECSSAPSILDMSMKKLKDFARNKKIKHCGKADLTSENEHLQEDVSGSDSTKHYATQCPVVPEHPDAFNNLGFICAYCAAKFPERRFLIKHLLRDHGAITKVDQKPQVPGKYTMCLHIPMQ
jgi:hypothetical protein